MADSRKTHIIQSQDIGELVISDEVLSGIAALAATEVKGVYSLAGTLSSEISKYIGRNSLSKGIRTEIKDDEIVFDISLKIDYGYNIMDVSNEVQEKVKSTVENMTGMKVSEVNVRISDVAVDSND